MGLEILFFAQGTMPGNTPLHYYLRTSTLPTSHMLLLHREGDPLPRQAEWPPQGPTAKVPSPGPSPPDSQ